MRRFSSLALLFAVASSASVRRLRSELSSSLAAGGSSGAARVVFDTGADPHVAGGGDNEKALALMEEVLAANKEYATHEGAAAAELFGGGQHPRLTLLACSDSRVQAEQFTAHHSDHQHPHDGGVGDIFTVRVIGNMLATAAGSVEYGVRHLHTPVLLVVGHTLCGAVKAVLGGTAVVDGLEPAIKKELKSMDLGDSKGVAAVTANVHAQVDAAVAMFEDLVGSKLAVIGAVFDIADSLGNGAGVLNIININGVKSKAAVKDIMRKKAYFPKSAGGEKNEPA